eukprot:1179140-Prorocentrum_lima.AAC.1
MAEVQCVECAASWHPPLLLGMVPMLDLVYDDDPLEGIWYDVCLLLCQTEKKLCLPMGGSSQTL